MSARGNPGAARPRRPRISSPSRAGDDTGLAALLLRGAPTPGVADAAAGPAEHTAPRQSGLRGASGVSAGSRSVGRRRGSCTSRLRGPSAGDTAWGAGAWGGPRSSSKHTARAGRWTCARQGPHSSTGPQAGPPRLVAAAEPDGRAGTGSCAQRHERLRCVRCLRDATPPCGLHWAPQAPCTCREGVCHADLQTPHWKAGAEGQSLSQRRPRQG